MDGSLIKCNGSKHWFRGDDCPDFNCLHQYKRDCHLHNNTNSQRMCRYNSGSSGYS